MHVIGTLLAALFTALLVGVALTFGLALFGALLLVGIGMVAMIYGQQLWLRWRFKHYANKAEAEVSQSQNKIIEADYTEIKRED